MKKYLVLTCLIALHFGCAGPSKSEKAAQQQAAAQAADAYSQCVMNFISEYADSDETTGTLVDAAEFECEDALSAYKAAEMGARSEYLLQGRIEEQVDQMAKDLQDTTRKQATNETIKARGANP